MAKPEIITIENKINILGIQIPTTTDRFLVNPDTGIIQILDTNNQPIFTGNGPNDVYTLTDPGQKKLVWEAYNKKLGSTIIDPNTGKPISNSAPTKNQKSISSGNPEINVNKKLSKKTLKYPDNLNESSNGKQTYIKFKSYDFSTVRSSSNDIFGIGKNIGKVSGDFLSGIVGAVEPIPYPTDEIKLYVPPNINVGYGANWGEAALGAAGSSTQPSSGNNLLETLSSFFGTFNQSLTRTGINAIVDKMTNIPDFNASGQDLIGLTTGLVFNKNEFSTFNNIPMRTFQYSFLLVARNENEKRNINQIINVFKIGMHPAGPTIGSGGTITSIGGGSNGFSAVARSPILKYPKLWTIEYMIGDNNNMYIPRTKYCAITSFNLNYTPNSVFTTLTDGQVPAIQMDISFKELTPLIADQIIDGNLLGGDFSNVGVTATDNINSDYNPNIGGTF
jgi:Tail-tube assembly protein